MTFEHPEFLIALILVPLAALFLYWASRQRRQVLSRLGDLALIRRLSDTVNWRGRRWRHFLWLAALGLLVFSIARPQWGSEVQEIEQEGLQVMIALDVSQSMLAEDIKPTRLDRAKQEISDLTQQLQGDEIGVVLFSGAAFVQVPLTSDYVTALNYLKNAGPTAISRPGTVIADAIRMATQGFDEKLSSQKVLVVMTDGEDVESDPQAVAQAAADEGVLIYTIGFGTPEGETVPQTDSTGRVVGVKKDAQGNPVISKMNEETLQRIAEIGGGDYYRATTEGSELKLLLAELDGLQRAELQSRQAVRKFEHYQPFLALALAALVVAELIPDRVRRRAAARRPAPAAAPAQTQAAEVKI